jgi:hypothetical protein
VTKGKLIIWCKRPQNFTDPQTDVSMEGTAICKRIGKCDMFYVALFIPAFRACRNADVAQLL